MQKKWTSYASGGFSLEDHQLFRFDIEKCRVDKAVLENESLIFAGPPKEVILPSNLLEEFTDLAEADPKSICDFANKWGRLGFCAHDLPATHSTLTVTKNSARSLCKERPSETIQEWRRWSKKFKIIWGASMTLHAGEHANQQDWEIVFADSSWDRDFWESLSTHKSWDRTTYWKSKSLVAEWGLLMELLNYYIGLSALRFHFTFGLAHNLSTVVPRITLGCPDYGSLFGMLTAQLAFAVSNTEGSVICTSCGLPFFPKRRPKAGQRRFCDRPTCGRRAANRHAARDFRQIHPNYRRQFD